MGVALHKTGGLGGRCCTLLPEPLRKSVHFIPHMSRLEGGATHVKTTCRSRQTNTIENKYSKASILTVFALAPNPRQTSTLASFILRSPLLRPTDTISYNTTSSRGAGTHHSAFEEGRRPRPRVRALNVCQSFALQLTPRSCSSLCHSL